jgi:Asp/Glu/hydantoin racemase
MRTEIISGVEVTVVENQQDMYSIIEGYKMSYFISPLTFNVRCNDRTVTNTDGF